MRSSYFLFTLLAFLGVSFCSPSEGGGAKKKSAGNLYLLTITVGTHDPKGTPDDWNYTGVELEEIVKARCGPLFRDVKSNLVKGSQASPKGVLDALAWLSDNVKEQDLALVYIGAHGGSGGKRGFCLYANGGNVYGDEIKPALAKVKGRVVLVVQACNAGDLLVKHGKDLQAMPSNVAAICACKAGQCSHGILLPPIMEGLHGYADINKDGVVTIGEFLHYIEHRVGDFYPGHWADTQQAATSIAKDFDLSTPLAKSLNPKKLGKEVVMIELRTDWYGGVIVQKKDPMKKGKALVHFFGDKSSEDEWVEKDRICPFDAEPVVVKSGEKWYAAALLGEQGKRYRIRYIGVMDNKEETVPRNRIQALSLDPPPGAAVEKKEKKK